LQISEIGIGVLVGSAAMQWAGFLLLALLMIVVATTQQKVTDLTIAEARAKLDEIEANEDTTQ
jgi:flagellar biogenesis protein FliO